MVASEDPVSTDSIPSARLTKPFSVAELVALVTQSLENLAGSYNIAQMASAAAAVLLGLLSAAAPGALAGQTAGTEEEPRYDAASVISVMATVMEIREVPRGKPLSGVHLLVKTERETLDSHLGPPEFLKECGGQFAKGDRIQLAGSRVKYGAGFVLLVREVRKDNSTVYLRDEKGNPNWPPDQGKS